MHLLDLLAAALLGLQDGRVDDLDGVGARTVPASHLLVHVAYRDVAVVLVHVVRVRAALVAQPDAVVVHLQRLLLEDLVEAQELAVALGLVQLLHEVPEPGLGQHLVLGEGSRSRRRRLPSSSSRQSSFLLSPVSSSRAWALFSSISASVSSFSESAIKRPIMAIAPVLASPFLAYLSGPCNETCRWSA